jgi:hypothetical protein
MWGHIDDQKMMKSTGEYVLSRRSSMMEIGVVVVEIGTGLG